MTKKTVVTESVVDAFVEFCGVITRASVVEHLPEFNKQNNAKFTVNAMIDGIQLYVGDLDADNAKAEETPAEAENPEGWQVVETSVEENNQDGSATEVVSDEKAAQADVPASESAIVEATEEVIIDTHVEVKPAGKTYDFSNLNVDFIKMNLGIVSRVSVEAKKAADRLAYAAELTAAIPVGEKKIAGLNMEIDCIQASIDAKFAEIRANVEDQFEVFYRTDENGKHVKSLMDNLENLEDPQRNAVRAIVDYLEKKFKEADENTHIMKEIDVLRANKANLRKRVTEIEEAIKSARVEIPLYKDQANRIRKAVGLSAIA